METPYLTRKYIMRSLHYERNYKRVMVLLMLLLPVQFFTVIKLTDSLFLAYGSTGIMFAVYSLLLIRTWYKRFGNYSAGLDVGMVFSQILWVTMKDHFQNVEFNSQKQIPKEVIWAPGFSFTEDSYVYEPSNYAAAMCGGTPVEVQYMKIGVMETQTDLEGNHGSAYSYQVLAPHFKGMIYLCHLGWPFPPTTVHTGKQQAGEIKTGDAAFDKHFSVKTQNPRNVLLSDGMRQFLTAYAEKIKGKIYIHFAANGDVYVAVHQKIYDDTPRRAAEPFERLDLQMEMVKGLIGGFRRGV